MRPDQGRRFSADSHGRDGPIPVRRFPVKHQRDPLEFGRRSDRVFQRPHSILDELEWLDAEGPNAPGLISYLTKHASDYDQCIVFSYRYHHAYHAVRAVPSKCRR